MDVRSFWHNVISKNREELPYYFCQDAVIRWHCSNEQFTVLEYIKANCDYPGEWEGEIERIEENVNTIILAGRVFPTDKSASFHVVSFMKLRNNKICELDEYWAEDDEVPAWRKAMGIGRAI